MNKICTNLDLSKKLSEVGISKPSLFVWLQCEEYDEFVLETKIKADNIIKSDGLRGDTGRMHEFYPAYTCGELMEMLPRGTALGRRDFIYSSLDLSGMVDNRNRKHNGSNSETSDTYQGALAQMLLYLKEQGLYEN